MAITKPKKLLFSLIYIALLTSAVLFFVYPHHAYVSKLIYLVVLTVLGIWYFRKGNRRAMFSCIIGSLCIIFLLPANRTVNHIGVIVMIAGWVVAGIVYKKSNQSAPE